MISESTDVVVVGGGLAGLTEAAYLTRGGRRVMVLEKGRELGGRARTNVEDGFSFNLGPHAVFLAGAGAAVMRDLGVPFEGGEPGGGSFVLRGGRMHTLPEGFVSLVSTGLFGLREKVELGGLTAGIQRMDTSAIASVPFADWATYSYPVDEMSAGAAVRQGQLVLQKGVRYVDGGWQTLVDALRAMVVAGGGELVTGEAVRSVVHDTAVRGVLLENGRGIASQAVVIAGSPEMAGELTGMREWALRSVPIRIACLDVALRLLPKPGQKAVFGMDEPLYGSVHSAVARLAPEGGAMVHMARYGGLQGHRAQDVRLQLEGLLEQLQPGWREHVVRTRFLPELAVSHAAVMASQGGLAGRPGPAVAGMAGLFLAGDWVGEEGMLADASFSSGRKAARLILGLEGMRREEAA